MFGLDKGSSGPKLNWPKAADGSLEKAVYLCHIPCIDFRDELIVNLLESCGIPSLKNYPGNGEFGKVVLGMSGDGTDIYVPESLLEDAKAIVFDETEVQYE